MEKKKKKHIPSNRETICSTQTNQQTTCSKKKTVITTGNAGTCLANELPGDAVRLDLDFPNMYHQPKPQAPAQMAKWPSSVGAKVYAP